MHQYKYIFEKGSKKHQCPACHKKRFVRYIDVQTKEYLPEIYGKCDREMNCGYHLNPYKNGYAKDNKIKSEFNYQTIKPLVKPKRVCIPKDVFYKTRKAYEENTFIQNLLNNIAFPFESEDIEKIIAQYHLGTIIKGYRKSATTFPFIDIDNNVRAIQVKQFDKNNHTIGTDFLHSIIEKYYSHSNQQIPNWLKGYNKNETKVSCLFGEHLLSKYPLNPVALVEAPKTAIYGTLYFGFPNNPKNLLWLAVYNLSSLNINKCKALKGRNVYLFPDLSKEGKAFNLWSNKAQKIQQQLDNSFFKVSDLLEELAPNQDKEEGKDIADYLIKLDWREFRERQIRVSVPYPTIIKKVEVNNPISSFGSGKPQAASEPSIIQNNTCFEGIISIKEKLINWDDEIKELETFFKSNKIPLAPIQLNQCSIIIDVSKFIKSHLSTVKAQNGNPIYLSYLERLFKLKDYIYL
ncbi:hypothetical protein BTO05_00825 [Winogradskyella sp. PC-19]|uniref:DUF6965 family protein n=1 Tax=Winogradskyella sp. PC-19 TaxID=754417 RepID=UPI000B570BC7|nr:DUF6371 domain-containing protein [Winogradskyella sp. PC-19]ARV08249.1 hypothetical protein BTO05_00825 [Winogradskyella sp. PC-19]